MTDETVTSARPRRVLRRAGRLGGFAAVLLAACSGPSVLVVGESVRPPEPPPPEFQLSILASDDLTPLAAALNVDDVSLEASRMGRATLTWLDEPISITASAPGFHPVTTTVELFPEEGPVELRLAPVVLSGTVTGPTGKPLEGSTVTLGDLSARTGTDGSFRFIRAVAGDLEVTRPAWEPTTLAWDGAAERVTVEIQPRTIRALRVQASKTGDPESWAEILELAETTEINALVIDTKDERGRVFHDTGVETAHEIGAVQALYDVEEVLADMEERGLYKITRIVTFQDPWLAPFNPSIAAIYKPTGAVWETYSGRAWLDPTDRDAWTYPLALAEEACDLGFDEIQFDYVRFPSDGPLRERDTGRLLIRFDGLDDDEYYGEAAQTVRVETIAAFLREAHDRLNPKGCAVAADIFAITLQSRSDEGIGQKPGPLASSVDVLSPMIYSYAYGSGWRGFEDPNDNAPEIVQLALDDGIKKLVEAEGFGIYRPWLQRAFLESSEILAVQQVAEDRGLGWMIWSENTQFDATMFEPAP